MSYKRRPKSHINNQCRELKNGVIIQKIWKQGNNNKDSESFRSNNCKEGESMRSKESINRKLKDKNCREPIKKCLWIVKK